MPHNPEVYHASDLVIGIIVFFYLIFAGRIIWNMIRVKRSFAENYPVLSVVFVFVLCATCGYATAIFSDRLWMLRELLHWALAVCAMWLALSDVAERLTRDSNGSTS